ncbi:nickel-dependent hydrogenase large subunit [Ammonifex thiophilus]|uniref:Nickel-dependent hydrogenase large subunit n=1 Tax=Ammonifex thiophilus TaxID=444093 RepID=A0A3D8P4N4_9THEO|nr:nickel-dependent hydrogenase large subunit [Ammonifex thiophilus]RDV84176.1 nickel-dependent hydrogenase large subunit [Ammonifex thiophilus]
MATKVIVDPMTRIEGHLKIEVEVANGKVVNAWSSGTLFRGIEIILKGRDPRDAQHVAQRICGVCPLSHGIASVLCLDDAFQAQVPSNGRIIRNLIQGANYIQSHILHFYTLAALDYVKGPDTSPFVPRFKGDYRLPPKVNELLVQHYLEAFDARRKAHKMLAVFGAKAPHPTVFIPGGVTETVTAERVEKFRAYLEELIRFIDQTYVPDVKTVAEYYSDYWDIGRGCRNMLAYGGFPQADGQAGRRDLFFKPGVYTNGKFAPFDPQKIVEDVKYSWYANDTSGLPPARGETVPQPRKAGAYSWLKAPRYDGLPHEVGPLARSWINQVPEILSLGERAFSVLGRHYARALECSRLAHAMLDWLRQLKVGEPVYLPAQVPEEAHGVGLTEAARGALGHWIEIKNYRIANYQAVVPTTWNASPRDDRGQPGPIEQALIGTPVQDPENPVEITRVVRSFDPCLACAIHLLELRVYSRRGPSSFRI